MFGDINVLYERVFNFLLVLRNVDGKVNLGGMYFLFRLGLYLILRIIILVFSFKCNMFFNVKMYEDCCGGFDCNFIFFGVKIRYFFF